MFLIKVSVMIRGVKDRHIKVMKKNTVSLFFVLIGI